MIDVAAARRLTGKSHVAIGRALQQLEGAGIIVRLNERKWGRVWECDELLGLVDTFERNVRTDTDLEQATGHAEIHRRHRRGDGSVAGAVYGDAEWADAPAEVPDRSV